MLLCGTTQYDTTTHFCDIRDSNVYKWVKIGTQTWMAENLNFVYKKGDSVYGNWCYGDSTEYCAQYGRLYTWGAAMDSATTGCGYGTCGAFSGNVRGVCPTGWHLPSRAEWNTLCTAVGDSMGTKLKSSSGWNLNGNGSDAYGFSALPSGDRINDGRFNGVGDFADFWSSSAANASSAYDVVLYYNSAGARLNDDILKNYGFAVRCVKD